MDGGKGRYRARGRRALTIPAMHRSVGTRLRETVAQRQRRLAALDRRLDALVFVAALMSVPAAVEPGELTGPILVVDIVAWLIFVFEAIVKLAAHGRREYLGERWNWVDLAIIVLSAPYHLATGIALVARLGSLARLARLVRIALVMVKVLRQGRSLLSRRNIPGAAAIVALATVGVATFVFYVESGASNEAFGSFGDAVWWALVTLTTVGYGDLAPVTIGGRIGAVVLMIVGVAFLGTVAASLASLFVEQAADREPEEDPESGPGPELALLRTEIEELRRAVETLTARLEA